MSYRVRKIKGNMYLYFAYYENGEKKEVYCGLASDEKSMKKALQAELDYLKKQKNVVLQKIDDVELKLSKIK